MAPSSDTADGRVHLTRDGGWQWSEEFRAINPQKRVPALALSTGEVLIQSLAIIEYFDEVHPEPPLLPADAAARAHVRAFAQIIACDIDAKRLDTVMSLARRLKLTIIEPKMLSESVEPPPGPFDAALVDVPCSNTGVLGRRPEVRWRLKPREFEHLIRLQTRLLLAAFERVKPGGAVV